MGQKYDQPGPSGLNHHLGVYMEMDFVIPKGGKTDDGKPIEFNFSGDDDMWVFIDNELVLDIGGLHQPVDGTINFATGVATITGKATQAGHSNNTGNAAIATVKGVTDNRGNDFHFYQALDMPDGGDNQVHTMRIFYLERGGCDSNCMISFNLPLVNAKGSVTVAKCEATEDGSKPVKKLAGVKFGVYKTSDCTGTPFMEVYSDENGLIDFNNLGIEDPETSRYYLKELQPLPGYKQNTEVYALVPDQKLDEATYTLKVVDSKGEKVGTIGEEPQIYPAILNEKEKAELKVIKIWKDVDGKTVSGPEGAEISVTLKRYELIKDKQETPKGTLKIKQNLGGDGANTGKAYFKAEYTVKKDGRVIRTGSYTGTDGATESGLEPGEYIVETVCTSTNASYSVKETTQRSDKITVSGNGTAEVTLSNELKKNTQTYNRYTVTVHAPDNNQGSKTFTYYQGTQVSLIFDYTQETWIKTSRPSDGGGYGVSVKIDGKDKGLVFNDAKNKKTFSFTVNGNVDIELTNTGYSNWNNVVNKCMYLSPADLNNQMKSPSRRSLKANGNNDTPGGSVISLVVNNSADTPVAPAGYTISMDAEDVINWTQMVSLPDDGAWEKTVSGLDKYDAEGNPYVYYMASVTENGVPAGTTAVITTDGTNKQIVRGDSTDTLDNKVLSVTDTIPAMTQFVARKGWKNTDGTTTPPDGATVTFQLYADGRITGKTVVLNGRQDVGKAEDITNTQTQEVNAAAIAADAYESESWKALWLNLPKYRMDENGNYLIDGQGNRSEISYSVRESIGYSGYTPDVNTLETDGGTITNTQNGKPQEEIPDPDNTNPEIHKRIDALRDGDPNLDTDLDEQEDKTDLYRLYLDYKINAIQEPKGVDLLLVLDHSGSMNSNEYSGNENRAPTVEKVLNGADGLIAEYLAMNPNNRWAAIGFNGPSGINYVIDEDYRSPNAGETDSEVLTSGTSDTSWINARQDIHLPMDNRVIRVPSIWFPWYEDIPIGPTILTDYTAGFWRAEQFLQNNDGRKKVIVFISDGIPTLYIDCDDDRSLKNEDRKSGSKYFEDDNGVGGCPEETLRQFGYFVNDLTGENGYGYTFGKDIELFTLGFGDSMNSAVSETTGKKLLKDMLTAAYGSDVPAGHFIGIGDGPVAETAEKMKSALETVTGAKETFTNLVIEDQLTSYVDLYDIEKHGNNTTEILKAAKAKITMTDPEDASKVVVLYDSGQIQSKGVDILDHVTYDKESRKITVAFNAGYQAQPGIKYTLSFDVKATDAAYTAYAGEGNQYPVTGDEDTDYIDPGTGTKNKTSSKKEGLYSNTSATATYKHNGEKETRDYKKPVIQVFNAPIKLLKIDQEGKALAGARFDLYKDVYDASGTQAAQTANAKNKVNTIELVAKLKGTGQDQVAEISAEKLRPGTYYLVETAPPDGYNSIAPIKIVVKVTTVTNGGENHDETVDTVTVTGFTTDDRETPIGAGYLSGKDGEWTLQVMNTAGYELPSTGGSGTYPVYLLGGLLTVLAGTMFLLQTMLQKRRNYS